MNVDFDPTLPIIEDLVLQLWLAHFQKDEQTLQARIGRDEILQLSAPE